MSAPEFAVILSTCKTKREAELIATRLVEDGAAACINIIDKVTSIYHWKGKTETSTEALLVIKTRAVLIDRVAGTIKGFSSYDCPEVIVLPILEGSEEFLRWVTDVTTPG
ncbi:MAG: divalent-cation tolerance protein CutA [candidate division Zixibacteria bacterium]|nr:divalent-cation tolerance protein CutA [candidate division Zixibacteria bacterium]